MVTLAPGQLAADLDFGIHDTEGPEITVSAPTVTADTTPQITGTIVDADDNASIEVTVNGATYAATNNGDDTCGPGGFEPGPGLPPPAVFPATMELWIVVVAKRQRRLRRRSGPSGCGVRQRPSAGP